MFNEEDKRIFRYKDSFGRDRAVDPIEVYCSLMSSAEYQYDVKAVVANVQPDAAQALQRLIGAYAKAFKVVVFSDDEPEGMLREDLMKLFQNFERWADKKKESTEQPPTLLSCSGRKRSVRKVTMKSSSDCG